MGFENKKMLNKNQKKLVHYCYDLLARRRYSIHDIVRKLESYNHKKGDLCTDGELKEILEGLIKSNLLNDQEYANMYLDSQIRRKPVGKIKIKMQLRKKGIDEDMINQAINLAELDEEQLAKELLEKNAKKYSHEQLSDPKIQARIIRFLGSNGFNGSLSYQVFKNYLRHVQVP